MIDNARSAVEHNELTGSGWAGYDLGSRTIGYRESDVILYALAVGARDSELALIDEARLRVLPTFALTLCQWAPDELGKLGAFDTTIAVHGAQTLTVLRELPAAGTIDIAASVTAVWDKGSAAVFDIEARSDYFTATWSLFVPGGGGFGGDRGPRRAAGPKLDGPVLKFCTWREQAALYRLCGDMHRIHIDPTAAAKIGQPRPILHGLCTLGGAVLTIARQFDYSPVDLTHLSARFAAAVLPGDDLTILTKRTDREVWFSASGPRADVLTDAAATFG